MLRVLIGLLLLANAGYFAWTQGYLTVLGLAPAQQSEPERLHAQIRPEGLRLLNGPQPASTVPDTATGVKAPASPAVETASLENPVTATEVPAPPTPPAPAATACWIATGFSPEQADTLRTAMGNLGLPARSWQLSETRSGGRWVVYMGRYNEEQMARKKGELRDIKVDFREVNIPVLGRGLALGTFSSEASAEQALQDLGKKGVRTARVAQERPEGTSFNLRFPAITTAQRAEVESLGAALAGKELQACE